MFGVIERLITMPRRRKILAINQDAKGETPSKSDVVKNRKNLGKNAIVIRNIISTILLLSVALVTLNPFMVTNKTAQKDYDGVTVKVGKSSGDTVGGSNMPQIKVATFQHATPIHDNSITSLYSGVASTIDGGKKEDEEQYAAFLEEAHRKERAFKAGESSGDTASRSYMPQMNDDTLQHATPIQQYAAFLEEAHRKERAPSPSAKQLKETPK